MGFEIDADEFERNLVEALEEETGLRFGEENEIQFTELFPEEFMRLYTEFDSMDTFLNASKWDVETQEDFREIPDEPFDEYVDEHTDFPNWEVMHQTASQRFLERRLT